MSAWEFLGRLGFMGLKSGSSKSSACRLLALCGVEGSCLSLLIVDVQPFLQVSAIGDVLLKI